MGGSGQTAIVTGGGSGVGQAVAESLIDAGYKVVIVGRRAEKLADTVRRLETRGTIRAKAGDVSVGADASRVVSETIAEFGAVNLLVNNAGVNVRHRKLDVLSVEDWEYLIRVNLTGTFHMVRAVLPGMRAAKAGLVINISSVAGVRPSSLGGAGYSASKFGVNGLSGTLSLEENENGIRSTVICPGEINTPILDERPVPVSQERREAMLQPEDVAAAVLFVAKLPPRAHVPELIIKPTSQVFA